MTPSYGGSGTVPETETASACSQTLLLSDASETVRYTVGKATQDREVCEDCEVQCWTSFIHPYADADRQRSDFRYTSR